MVLKRLLQFVIVVFVESPINVVLWIKHQKMKWAYESDLSIGDLNPGDTSISDSHENLDFLKLCKLASEDQEIFSKFRSNKDFAKVLEHVDYWRGHLYAAKIRGKKPEIFLNDFIDRYETIGGPLQYKFRSFPICSPSILRYISVQLELNEYFGNLHELIITEIGVGYGGQAVTTSHFAKPKLYNLYDLPEVLGLAEKFTSSLALPVIFKYYDGRNPKTIDSDLIISNYAFSELERTLQVLYLKKVLLQSRMGYITWNDLSMKRLGGLSVDELLSAIPGSEVLEENPSTASGNVVIVWGRKK
jgi:hypothetical protein